MATAKWDIQDKFPQPLLRIVGQITIAAGQLEYVLKLAYKRARGESFDVGRREGRSSGYAGDRPCDYASRGQSLGQEPRYAMPSRPLAGFPKAGL